MRLHVVSLPHTQAAADFPSCAFTQKVRRFCRMMSDRGQEVLLYARERTDAPCVELIPCISENKRRKMVGDRHYTEADWSHPYWNGFNARVIDALEERLGARDFICLIGGWSHKPIAYAFPNHVSVEFGIGYAYSLLSVLSHCFYVIMTRHMGATETSGSLIFYSALVPVVLLSPAVPVVG